MRLGELCESAARWKDVRQRLAITHILDEFESELNIDERGSEQQVGQW